MVHLMVEEYHRDSQWAIRELLCYIEIANGPLGDRRKRRDSQLAIR